MRGMEEDEGASCIIVHRGCEAPVNSQAKHLVHTQSIVVVDAADPE